MKIGLYFGSFNPVHIGHMAIASYMVEYTDLNRLWFVVSPQNPFKKRHALLEGHHRLEMVSLAIGDDQRFRESDIEFKMPRPSYTIDTLAYLSDRYPGHKFVLIMGSDSLPGFDKWKNAEQIIRDYPRYVYPREAYPVNEGEHRNIRLVEAPRIELSASMIRQGIREGRDMSHFLPPAVWKYIDEMNFYR
jgi:nicotinate-nucleotide adenylyltransferase